MPPKKVQNQLKPAPLPSSSSAVVPTRTPPTPPPPPTPPGAKEDPRLVPVILGEEYDVPSGVGSRAESAEERSIKTLFIELANTFSSLLTWFELKGLTIFFIT